MSVSSTTAQDCSDTHSNIRFEYDKVQIVGPNGAAHTYAFSAKPLLVTNGGSIWPVTVVGYEPINKIAIIINFFTSQSLLDFGNKLHRKINKIFANSDCSPIDVHLRGGDLSSQEFIYKVKEWITGSPVTMQIVSEKVLQGKPWGLLMDAQDGQMYDCPTTLSLPEGFEAVEHPPFEPFISSSTEDPRDVVKSKMKIFMDMPVTIHRDGGAASRALSDYLDSLEMVFGVPKNAFAEDSEESS